MSGGLPRVAFVLEQHVGHRTYAENLRAPIDAAGLVDAVWVPVTYGAGSTYSGVLGPLRRKLAARREVRDGIDAAGADAHVFNTQVPAALGGRRARSKPYIAITDVTPVQYDAMAEGYGHRPDGRGPLRWWKHRVNRRVFQGASRCVGWSSWAAQSIIDDYGVDPSRVAVIPPGIDTRLWSPAERHEDGRLPRILFVGGEFERKGGDVLLQAFAPLSDRAELWVVTKSVVASGNGVHVVNDLGPNDPRLIELFRSAAVFALPSRAETFGIAALEAASTGVPVVAARVGGLADIVEDGVTGYTVPVGDVAALTDALARVIDDPRLQADLGRAARDRAVSRYDAVTNADLIVAEVMTILGSP